MEEGGGEDMNIRVVVRCRPLNSKERNNNESSIVKINDGIIKLINPAANNDDHSFSFDSIFGPDCLQSEVWETVGLPILDKAIAGYNGTIFAYGQTGSGKTWSMQGGDDDLRGIIPRMSVSLFEKVATERKTRATTQFLITVSYFEIYNEVIFDLLDASDRKKKLGNNKGGLEIKEHPALGVYVKGLQEIVVEDGSKLQGIIDQGMRNRTVASTQMNADSSRSHSVFMITVHQKDTEDESKNIFAKINLVDLAGSERVKSTGATGATLKEGANINKSLSALGNVINALVEAGKGKNTFIPYRNSKLTRVLQESLGGNSITTMLAALSPAACNFEETLSTLKYANRAKAIKVKAVKNEEASQVSRLNEEIRLLREKLLQQGDRGDVGGSGVGSEKNQQQLMELEMALKNTWESKAKISKEYEEERSRLLQEQQAAAQQLRAAKERNWMLLEEKGQAELTISHVKDLCKAASSHLEEHVDALQRQLLALETQEKKAQDQQSVCAVFRSALEKDVQALLQVKCTSADHHNAVVIALRQVCSKAQAMQEEIQRWVPIAQYVYKLLYDVRHCAETLFQRIYGTFGKHGEELREDVLRGLWMIVKQLRARETVIKQQLITVSKVVGDAGGVREGLLSFGAQYEQSVKRDVVAWSNAEEVLKVLTEAVRSLKFVQSQAASESKYSDSEDAHPVETLPYILKDGDSSSFFVQTSHNSNSQSDSVDFGESTSFVSKQRVAPIATENDPNRSIILDLQEPITLHSVQFSPATISQDPARLKMKVSSNNNNNNSKQAAIPEEDDEDGSSEDGGDEETNDNYEPETHLLPSDSAMSLKHSASTAFASNISFASLQLPCGLSSVSLIEFFRQNLDQQQPVMVADDSAIEAIAKDTAQAMGDLLDWTVLLKQHDPVKFLRRPPVRFLFDLFQHLAQQYKCCASTLVPSADWTVVAATRESKTEYMDSVLRALSQELEEVCAAEDPKTCDLLVSAIRQHSGNNIVAGTDTDKTNRMLQLLALCVYRRYTMHTRSSHAAVSSLNKENNTSSSTSNLAANRNANQTMASGVNKRKKQLHNTPKTIVFIEQARVRVSEDGVHWTDVSVQAQQASESRTLVLTAAQQTSPRTRYISLTIDSFASESLDGNNALSSSPYLAIRAKITGSRAISSFSSTSTSSSSSKHRETQQQQQWLTGAISTWQRVSDSWTLWTQVATTTVTCDQQERSKKLDEARKRIEKEAADQAQRAQSLATEKDALQSSNADLAAQLQQLLAQLLTAQQTITELQDTVQRLEETSGSLREQVSQRDQQMAEALTQRMFLETALEKEKSSVDQLQSDLYDKEQALASAQGKLKEANKRCDELETEREDLQQAMQVMQEERDTARQHEEELFEKLGDVTADLERLQESYVDVCDRCNDAQDEVSELRDQVESLQETLRIVRQQNIANSSNNIAHSASSAVSQHTNKAATTVVAANRQVTADEYDDEDYEQPAVTSTSILPSPVNTSTPAMRQLSIDMRAQEKPTMSTTSPTPLAQQKKASGGSVSSSSGAKKSQMASNLSALQSHDDSGMMHAAGAKLPGHSPVGAKHGKNSGSLSARSGTGEEDDYQEDFDDL